MLRVDGRAFSRLTGMHFRKPFDPRFHAGMRAACEALAFELAGSYPARPRTPRPGYRGALERAFP